MYTARQIVGVTNPLPSVYIYLCQKCGLKACRGHTHYVSVKQKMLPCQYKSQTMVSAQLNTLDIVVNNPHSCQVSFE